MKFHTPSLSARRSGRKRVRVIKTKAIVTAVRTDIYNSLFIAARNLMIFCPFSFSFSFSPAKSDTENIALPREDAGSQVSDYGLTRNRELIHRRKTLWV